MIGSTPRPRALSRLAAQTLLGLAFLTAWLFWFDGLAALTRLGEAPLGAALAMLTFTLLGYAARAYRWRALIPADRPVPRGSLFRLTVACAFLNYAIPLRVGDGFRAIGLHRRHGIPLSVAASSVVVDKLFDFAGLLLPLLAIGLGLFGDTGLLSVALLATVLAAGGLATLLWLARHGLLARLASWGPLARLGLVERILRPLDGYLRSLAGPRPLIAATLGTFAIVLADTLVLYAALGAFLPGPDFLRVLVGTALFGFSFILPAPPGYLGHTELMGHLVYSVALGLPGPAVAAGIVYWHVVNTVVVVIAGALATGRVALETLALGALRAPAARPAACDGGSLR